MTNQYYLLLVLKFHKQLGINGLKMSTWMMQKIIRSQRLLKQLQKLSVFWGSQTKLISGTIRYLHRRRVLTAFQSIVHGLVMVGCDRVNENKGDVQRILNEPHLYCHTTKMETFLHNGIINDTYKGKRAQDKREGSRSQESTFIVSTKGCKAVAGKNRGSNSDNVRYTSIIRGTI